MKKITVFLILISLLMIQSCRFMNELKHMDAPEIHSWAPGEEVHNPQDIGNISIEFSAGMDKNLTESAFSLTEDEEELKGDFSWEKDSLIFTPFTGFQSDRSYRILLKKSAEDEYGNSLKKEWTAGFATGSDEEPPAFLRAEPGDYSLLYDPRQVITLVFSEPPDQESFREALSLSPDMQYFLEWLEEKVIIHPLEDFETGGEVELTVSKDMKDAAGNALETEVSLIYRISALPEPVIVSLIPQSSGVSLSTAGVNGGIEAGDILSGSLNRALNEEERLNLATLTPDSPYEIIWDSVFQSFTLQFEHLEWQQYYDLNILDDNYLLYSDNENSRPPDLLSLAFCPESTSELPRILNLNGAMGASDSSSAFLEFLFSRSLSGEISRFSFMDALSFDSSVLSFETLGYEVFDGSQTPAPAVLPGAGESLIRIYLEISDTGLPGVVTFSLAETLSDSLGNTMEEPWSLTVNQP